MVGKYEKSTLEERESFSKLSSAASEINSWAVPLRKILETILKMDEGRTLTDGPNEKKIDNYAPYVSSERRKEQTR